MPRADRRRRSPARRRFVVVLIAAVWLVGGGLVGGGLVVGELAAGAAPVRAGAASATIPRQVSGPQLPGPDRDPAEAGDEARRILAGDAYRRRAEQRSLVDRVREWIKDHLPKLKRGSGSGDAAKPLSFVVVGIVGVAALAAIVWGLLNVRRGRRATGDDEPEGTVEITPLLSTDEWAAEAERLEAARQWRAALRARYRSLVGLLIDDGLVGDLPGRTPGEYRVELAAAVPAAEAAFTAATTMFESAWYGHDATSQADLHQFVALAGRVREEVGRRRRPAPALVGAGEEGSS